MRCFLFLIFSSLFFVSCQSNQNQIPEVGNLDSAAIALDTTMQLGFESSYEYHKTLVLNDKLVYDVIGYGGPAAKGEYAILRRGADNKADTLSKGIREGVIIDALLADSNGNNKAEVYVKVKSRATDSWSKVIRLETGDQYSK